MEKIIRGIVGFIVLLATVLAYFVDMRWLLLSGFIGIALFQSAFTNWCPMMIILEKLGYKKTGETCCTKR